MGRVEYNLYLMEQQTTEQTVGYQPFYIPHGIILPNVSDMPSEISYFLVAVRQSPKIILKGVIPHILTYKGDPTLQQLMGKYRQDTGYNHPKATHYNFTITSGIKLDPKFTIRDLKKMLARETLDGMVLYAQFGTGPVDDEEEYTDQCCVIDYFAKEREYGRRKRLWLRFQITLEGQPNMEVLYLQCTPYESRTGLMKRIAEQIRQQFNLKDLTEDNIIDISYIPQPGKKAVSMNGLRLSQQKLYNESTVFIKLSNPKKQQLKRVNAPKYNSWMVIYKENETEPIRVKYDDIANLTVNDLYRSHLMLKESQNRRDMVYCLKIMDRILTPQEKINSAEVYFKNTDSSKPLNVVAKVVNEKMIFYSTIPAIAAEKKAQFKLSQIEIPPNQQQRREECERTIRLRAEKAPQEYFKVAENVGPIVIYTSELMYKDRDAGQDLVIYQSLNKFLRETPILSLQKQNYQRDWRLRYASTLLKHLQKTQPWQGNAWRGVTYDPCLSAKDVGTVISFKQFTSTSDSQAVAASFARKHSSKEPYHLFSFKLKSGRSIKQYSIYEESEILLEPFTEFELKAVNIQTIDGKKFKVYDLEEKPTSKRLPGIKANFVIWIDPNTKESRAIFDKLSLPGETTVFEQLKSTQELKAWLQRQKGLFKDSTANLVFLTNMTRPEGKGMNQVAGVDAARLIRQYSKEVPIFFYIGNVQAATNKLVASKLNLESIFIGSSPKEVYGFLQLSVVGSV